MNISEAVARLNDAKGEYGDIEVYVLKGQGRSSFDTVENIQVVEQSSLRKKEIIVWIK